MIKRELKVNLSSFIIWTSILLIMFLVVFLVYPVLLSGDNIEMMNEMMAMFPEELLKAFNMDITSLDSAYGWMKSEGFIFILLISGIYAATLGGNIVLKEETERTCEYLNCLPVKRRNILLNKIIVSLIYIISMILFILIFNLIALLISGDFNVKQFIMLSITPILTSLPIFAIMLFISTSTKRFKKLFGIGLGFVFVNYFLNIVSELGEEVEIFKYFTLFTLADTRNIIIENSLNPWLIIISVLLTSGFIYGSFIQYERKELV